MSYLPSHPSFISLPTCSPRISSSPCSVVKHFLKNLGPSYDWEWYLSFWIWLVSLNKIIASYIYLEHGFRMKLFEEEWVWIIAWWWHIT
jgi:hypothetical protein